MLISWLILNSEATASGPGTFDGPRRYLEWARPVDLYLQYQQYAESTGQSIASFTTFLRLMKAIFQHHLRFRDKAEHAQCDVCHKLRSKIRKSKTKPEKDAATQSYSKHLLSQWLDRQRYWSMRTLSRHFFAQELHFAKKFSQSDLKSSLLTCIQDGMDQSKLRIPRNGYQRISKAMEKLYRPALHLVGTWFHGWSLRLSITDEDCKKDSQTMLELITLGLCNLVDTTNSLPLMFHLQQDNCAREGKNRWVVAYMLLLVILKIFRGTSMGFLRTAHSHEDIDQCFGQISRLLMGKRCGSADEMVALLADATMGGRGDDGAKSRLRASMVDCFKLDEVSIWKAFTEQVGLRFKGLRRVHFFRFCLRQDMGADVLDNVAEIEELHPKFRPHPEDIFLVTKRWLADTEIAGAIALVPASRAKEIREGFHPPAGLAARRTITDKVKKNLRKHVTELRRKGEMDAESI